MSPDNALCPDDPRTAQRVSRARVQLNSSSAHDKVDSFIKEIANYQITTYNSIIEDLHSNFDKKDSYIKSFSKMDLFDEPTISDRGVMLHKIGNNNMQILSYLIRWASA